MVDRCGSFDNADHRAFGRHWRLMRRRKVRSLRDLSDRSGISIAAIRKVELGASDPGFLTLVAIMDALEGSIDHLIRATNERSNQYQVSRGPETLRAEAAGHEARP